MSIDPMTEAVEAAAKAIHAVPGIECDHVDGKEPCCVRDAQAALDAALPLLCAQFAEDVATAIEAITSRNADGSFYGNLVKAAAIARDYGRNPA